MFLKTERDEQKDFNKQMYNLIQTEEKGLRAELREKLTEAGLKEVTNKKLGVVR